MADPIDYCTNETNCDIKELRKIDQCPECENKKIKEVGGQEIGYERSVSTGKILKKDKKGTTTWWKFTCKCGWESETFAE